MDLKTERKFWALLLVTVVIGVACQRNIPPSENAAAFDPSSIEGYWVMESVAAVDESNSTYKKLHDTSDVFAVEGEEKPTYSVISIDGLNFKELGSLKAVGCPQIAQRYSISKDEIKTWEKRDCDSRILQLTYFDANHLILKNKIHPTEKHLSEEFLWSYRRISGTASEVKAVIQQLEEQVGSNDEIEFF